MQSKDNYSLLINSVESFERNILDWGNYRIGYFIQKNKDALKNNEDTLFLNLNQSRLLIGVSDGAGGHPRGDEASLAAGRVVTDLKDDPFEPLNLIEEVNDEVINLKAGAATTLALVAIEQDYVRCFSVGDSEVLFWNAQGRKIYSNIPHSNVGHQIEGGVLDQEESLDAPDRNLVNNLIGDGLIRIESSSRISFKKNQTMLVGSDGLFDNFSHVDLRDLVGRGSFESSFDTLVDLCVNQNAETWKKDDDISFILIRRIIV